LFLFKIGRIPYCNSDAGVSIRCSITSYQTILFVRYVKIRPVHSVNTALAHSYMFQPSRGHPQGVLIHFVSRVNKMRVQM